MIDIKLIRENPDRIKAGMKAKEVDCDQLIDLILEQDKKRRELLSQVEVLKAQQNKVSKQIPAMKKAGEDTAPVLKEMAQIKEQIAAICADIDKVDNKAAKARVRKATLALEKAAKEYRKESVK